MDTHKIFDYVVGLSFVCSLLHSLLPPWDVLQDFPKAQKYYKVVVYIIGYLAVNARSTVYKSISTNGSTQGTKINDKENLKLS